MPRIRTIKPEFWDSPGTARASLRARLFFIALWGWADDWGVGTANPKHLIGYAFPNDDDVTVADFPRLRTEVATCYGVQWYEVDDRPYFAIPSWDDHQKNERRANRRNPTPDQGIPSGAETHGSSAPESGDSGIGTGEQGNRGTGEQDSLSPDESDDRGTLIPDNWRPNQAHIDKAISLHLDVKHEYQRFRTSASQKQRRLKNWNTGFTNWLRKQAEFNQQRQGSPAIITPRASKADLNAAEYQRLYGGQHERAGSVPALDPGIG